MTVKTIRVSKTSFKRWDLHGITEEALKTTCQADEIRVIPLHVNSVHGKPVDAELWINVKDASALGTDELNPYAHMILNSERERQGKEPTDDDPAVLGVGVLTGPGATDFPDDGYFLCNLSALAGGHKENENAHQDQDQNQG